MIFFLSIKARRLVATSENSAKIILYFISEMLKKYLGICIEMFRNIPLSICFIINSSHWPHSCNSIPRAVCTSVGIDNNTRKLHACSNTVYMKNTSKTSMFRTIDGFSGGGCYPPPILAITPPPPPRNKMSTPPKKFSIPPSIFGMINK